MKLNLRFHSWIKHQGNMVKGDVTTCHLLNSVIVVALWEENCPSFNFEYLQFHSPV